MWVFLHLNPSNGYVSSKILTAIIIDRRKIVEKIELDYGLDFEQNYELDTTLNFALDYLKLSSD